MEISVTGQHLTVTEPLRAYALDKLARINRHFDRVTATHVVLRIEKQRHVAEATIQAQGATLHADAEGADMYAALDALADKLDRQVVRHKEKRADHRGSPG